MKKTLLLSSIAALVAVIGGSTAANAADTWTDAISGTDAFMDDLATNHGWDKVNGNVTGYGVSSILDIMAGAATATDNVISKVNDSTNGIDAINAKLATLGTAATVNITDPAALPTDAADIETWSTAHASEIANIGETFGVFALKLNEVNTDINNALDLKADKSVVGSQTTAFADETALAGKTIGAGAATDITVAGALGSLNTAAKNNADNIATNTTNISDINALLGSAQTSAATSGLLNGKTISGAGGANDLNVVNALNTVATTAAGLALNNTFTGQNTFQNNTLVKGTFGAGSNGTEFTVDGSGNIVAAGSATISGDINLAKSTVSGHDVLNVTGVDGVQAGAFVANGGEFQTATERFIAGDSKIQLKNDSDKTVFKVQNDGTMTLSNGTNTATLTGTANGLNVAEGLTVAGDKFTVASNGNVSTKGTVNVNGATLTGSSTTLTSDKQVVSSNGFKVNDDNSFLAGAFKLAGTTVTGINTDGSSVAGGDTGTLATGATIKLGAENALYTGGGSNITGTTPTLKTALANLDAEIGADADYGTSPINGVSGSANVKANIAAVNNKLGNVSSQSVNGSSATDLTTAVNDLNGNMNTVLGGIYKADGTYDNTVLMNTTTQNGFETGATSLSDALKKYADNVQAATGTTFAADGSFTNAFVKPTAVDYDGLTQTQSLVSAVSQLDKNIGTAVTTAYNNVAATNTVNENISAINATIGDITTLSTRDDAASVGNALYNGGTTKPTTVVAALNNIDATLGTIHGLKAKRAAAGEDKGNLAAGTTVEQHLVSLDDAIGDRSALTSSNAAINSAVQTDIATAFNTTGNLIGNMDFSSSQYIASAADLTEAVKTLDANLERVENKVERVEYQLKSGLAAMSALSALVPNARDCGNTQLSVGTGVYADRMGVAVGGFHYFNDHVLFNAGASYGGTKDWAFRAGVTFGL